MLPFTTVRSSSFTSVLKTTGRAPSATAVLLIRCTASTALSTVEINGRVTCRNSRPSNCVSRLCPIVSAVTLVASPAISIPAGFTVDGLPVGIQIVGRHHADFAVLHALVEILEMARVAGHEAYAALEVLGLRLIGEFQQLEFDVPTQLRGVSHDL